MLSRLPKGSHSTPLHYQQTVQAYFSFRLISTRGKLYKSSTFYEHTFFPRNYFQLSLFVPTKCMFITVNNDDLMIINFFYINIQEVMFFFVFFLYFLDWQCSQYFNGLLLKSGQEPGSDQGTETSIETVSIPGMCVLAAIETGPGRKRLGLPLLLLEVQCI